MSETIDRGSLGSRDAPEPARPGRVSPAEWQRLEPLLDAALECPAPRRAALIAELCAGDDALRSELERMVAECEEESALLDRSAAERFAAVLEDEPLALPEIAGQYRIIGEAGRGGMAVVYLARDLKHDRDVALKVIRPDLAASIARVRFLHEIGIAARLRHPHIVPLYDSGEMAAVTEPGNESPSFLYYVMPYEAGRSLRERLDNEGPLPADDVVHILRDVTGALVHAHQLGIVHRDIKPDNVLLSGQHALVADFGVARAVTAAATGPAAEHGSTALGTPAYMAPEQASPGARVDHRADIYAIGVLGFELLAGRPPSPGDASARPAPAAVPEAMRDLPRLRPELPAALVDVLARCVQERPDDRWQTADELLERLSSAPVTTNGEAESRRTNRRTALLGGGVGAIALAMLWLLLSDSRERSDLPLRLGRAVQLTSERGLELQPAVSPDGQEVAYAAGSSLGTRIAIRPTGGGRARWLTTDTLASEWSPRWSPDGSRILFLSAGGVSSAPVRGGPVREEIAARPDAPVRSADWSPDGRTITHVRRDSLLVHDPGSGSSRLIATGADLHSCRWSPHSEWLACVSGNSFYVTVGALSGIGPMFGNLAPSAIVLIPAAGGRPTAVTDSVSLNQSPVWSPDGRKLYYVSSRHGPRDIYAVDIRPRDSAAPTPVRVTTGLGVLSLDFPPDARRLVYAAYASTANVWAIQIPVDPGAAPVAASAASAVPVTSGNQTAEGVRVSPDRRWLIYDSNLGGNSDVYRMPIEGGDVEPLTHGVTDEFRGALSPDGKELAYHSFETGSRNIFLLTLATGSVRQLTRSAGQLAMANWSPDGQAISFFDMSTDEVFVTRRDADGRWDTPRVLVRGWRPEWSPDGRMIAFVSPTRGHIGIVPADGGSPRYIHVPGGDDPLAELALFSADGQQLYFKSHDADGRAAFWSIPAFGGRPRLLVRFDDPAWSSNRFDFASDGRRFYFTVEDRQSDIWRADVLAR